jgi:hypothetical protein
MSDSRRVPGDDAVALDFDTAEFRDGSAGGLSCHQCRLPVHDEYFTLGEGVYCARCAAALGELIARGPGLAGFARAFVFGLGAAIGGAVLWGLVTQLTGYEIGLIAIAVGWLVGVAVRRGSGGLGGPAFQVLAILLTYFSIVATYVPSILEALEEQAAVEFASVAPVAGEEGDPSSDGDAQWGSEPGTEEWPLAEDGDDPIGHRLEDGEAAVVISGVPRAVLIALAFGFAIAAPFLMGIENAMGLVIIGIALFEAWRQNKRFGLAPSGPFRVGERPGASSA